MNNNSNNNDSLNITNATEAKEYSDINIDNRILPLFRTPIITKKLTDKKRNKNNLNLLNLKKKLTYKFITLTEILKLYLKGINKYKMNLNKYLVDTNKLDLIFNIKNDEYYKLNLHLSNYLYKINKFISIFNINSLLYNIRLFVPTRLFKPQPCLKYDYRLRYILKNLTTNSRLYNFEKRNFVKIEERLNKEELTHLLVKGREYLNDLNYLINKNKNKLNNLALLSQSNIDSVSNQNTQRTSALGEVGNLNKESTLSTLPTKNFNSVLLTLDELKTKINKIETDSLAPRKVITNQNTNKITQTMNSILKNKSFDYKTDSISLNSNPVSVVYTNNKDNNSTIQNKPVINQYLKSMSINNMQRKGIFLFYSNIVNYNFKSGYEGETNKLITKIYNLLAISFKSMYCLISKPVFVITPDKIIIHLFYFLFIPNLLKYKKIHEAVKQGYYNKKKLKERKRKIKKQFSKFRKIKINVRIKLRKLSNLSLITVYPNKFKQLCSILSILFKKPVELDLVRLHYPYSDSNILVNLLGIMINKIKLRIIFRKLFEKAVIKNLNKISSNNNLNIIPAFLSGINIRVAGRVLTQRVIPRKTVKISRRGASARGKINYSDVARYTNKNKRGAFSITVTSGQIFV
uniref:ribosomal protein S3 n=1 Tax=Singerocybe alboinfundibuliformis TaxID=1346812 RepID=UPI0030FE5FCF